MTLMLKPSGEVDYQATYAHTHERHESYQKRNWGLRYMEHWLPTGVLRPGNSVLEIGCGNGKLCRRLAVQGHVVTGIDVVAGNYERGGYRFHEHDITKRPWPIDSKVFDVAMAFDLFEHLDYGDLMPTLIAFMSVGKRHVVSIPHCKSVGKLHRIIEPLKWWLDKLQLFGLWQLVHTRVTDKGGEISVLVKT